MRLLLAIFLSTVLEIVAFGATNIAWAQVCDPASPSFSAATIQFNHGVGADGIAVGDFDQDGDLDLAVGDHFTGANSNNRVALFINDGSGAFAIGDLLPVPARTTDLASSDFDGNGLTDIVVANFSPANSVSVYRGQAGGGFGPREDYPVISIAIAVAAGDLDGDGSPDLAVCIRAAGLHAIGVLLNNGDGTFGVMTPFSDLIFDPTDVSMADIDGDGDIDVLATNRGSSTLAVLRNDGSGVLAAPELYSTGAEPVGIALFDADGDGDTDAVVSTNFGQLVLFFNAGDGALGSAVQIGATGFGTSGVASVDYSGDGLGDLAVVRKPAGTVEFFLNTGGAFASVGVWSTDLGAIAPVAGDFDADGDEDLAVTNLGLFSGSVSVLLNQCDPGCLADINGDGVVDVLDFFAFVTAFAAGDLVVDINGDGAIDVLDFFAFIVEFAAGCP